MTLRTLIGDGLHRLPPRLHTLVAPEQRADLRHRLGRYLPWEEGVDLTPPELAPGETAGPPDFVGVGTLMSGAGWWYRLVVDHPGVSVRDDIAMERHYLSHFCTRPFGAAEVEQYHGWFPRRAATIAGEWTPSYLAFPWVAPLLAQAAPDARLLVMVRDPVERLRLGLAHTADNRAPHVGSYLDDAIERGFYARQVRRLLEFFPPEQVLTLQYERCVADPVGQLASTYRFLGLDEAHRPTAMYSPGGGTTAVTSCFEPDTLGRLVDIYSSDVADLVALVPGFDLSLWPTFAEAGLGTDDR